MYLRNSYFRSKTCLFFQKEKKKIAEFNLQMQQNSD